MKKGLVLLFAVLMAIAFASPVFCAISTPVVRLNLTKTVVITKEQLAAKVQEYKEAYGDVDEATVLDAMISDEILAQALARDGYTLDESQQNALLAEGKANIEAQIGQTLTDEQFNIVCIQYLGVSAEEYKVYLVNQYTVQAYVMAMKGDMFTSEAVMPTDAEIQNFYRTNMSSFISSENVKLSHIFFRADVDKAAALKKAQDVASQIKQGKITFEKAVSEYSDDADSINNGGEIGWLIIDDTDTRTYMGDNFFTEVFKLDAGDISDVIESLAGYHIVKVSVHNQTKILGLNDPISPVETMKVGDYIANYIYEAKVNATFQEAYLSLISDLKSQASIKYL